MTRTCQLPGLNIALVLQPVSLSSPPGVSRTPVAARKSEGSVAAISGEVSGREQCTHQLSGTWTCVLQSPALCYLVSQSELRTSGQSPPGEAERERERGIVVDSD